MNHPLHPVHTGKDECDAVVVDNCGLQKCSLCKATITSFKPAFDCLPCGFKLCHDCYRGFKHPAHVEHALFWLNPTQQHGRTWKCGACDKIGTQNGETRCYHCPECDFNLCKSCFEAIKRPLHEHFLSRTDVRYKYHRSFGEWCCDSCGRNNGPQNYFPRHCSSCSFDLCDSCCQPWFTPLHQHELYKADSLLVYQRFSGGWQCDNCSRRFTPDRNNTPFHCTDCEFDLCENCLRSSGNRGGFGAKSSFSDQGLSAWRSVSNQRIITRTAAGNPVTTPEEDSENINAVAPPEESSPCVVCLAKPKDATIVHGATGHVCCCVECARELQRRGACCPVCRAPIDIVIQQFVS